MIFFKKEKSFMMSNIIHKFPSLLLLIMVIFKFLNNIRYNQKYIVPTTIVHSGLKNEFVTKDMKAYDYTNYEIPLKKRRYRQRGIRLSR